MKHPRFFIFLHIHHIILYLYPTPDSKHHEGRVYSLLLVFNNFVSESLWVVNSVFDIWRCFYCVGCDKLSGFKIAGWLIFLLEIWEMPLYSMGKEMATHTGILAWRIPWTDESGWLQSLGSWRDRHDWSNLACMHCFLAYIVAKGKSTV